MTITHNEVYRCVSTCDARLSTGSESIAHARQVTRAGIAIIMLDVITLFEACGNVDLGCTVQLK